MKRLCVATVTVATVAGLSLLPSIDRRFPAVTVEAQSCSNVPPNAPYNGWAKNSTPSVNTGSLPTSVSAKDGSGNTVTVNPKALVESAVSEFNTWLSNNTNSGVQFGTTSSGGDVQVATGGVIVNGEPRASGFSATTVNNTVTSATITLDLNNVNSASSSAVSASGRSGTIPFFDPMGTVTPSGSDPSADYSSFIKESVKHELMHTMGLGDQSGVTQNSIMNGAYVPNDRAAGGQRGMPSDPTNCDSQALKNGYPPTPDEDPEWWYAYCGITSDDVRTCETQQDNYTYDFYDCSCELGASPVIVDLDGGGFRLTSADDGVRFDLLARGAPVQTAWTQSGRQEAFLVLDRDGNGTIDSGLELFGNVTPQSPPGPGEVRNGFRALAEYDRPSQGGDGDGAITEHDAVFDRLRLWVDANHDGISQPTELFTLASQNVVRIDLNPRESRRIDRYGNRMRYISQVRLDDPPRVRIAIDVFFKWHY